MSNKQDVKNEIYESRRFRYGLGILGCHILLFSAIAFLVLNVIDARQFSAGRDTLCDVTLSKTASCGNKYPCLVVNYQAQKNESKSTSSTTATIPRRQHKAKFPRDSKVARRLLRCRWPVCMPQIPCRISTAGDVRYDWGYPYVPIVLLSLAVAFLILYTSYLIHRCRSYVPFSLPESNTANSFVDPDKSRPSS